jgi:hypothetical protein
LGHCRAREAERSEIPDASVGPDAQTITQEFAYERGEVTANRPVNSSLRVASRDTASRAYAPASLELFNNTSAAPKPDFNPSALWDIAGLRAVTQPIARHRRLPCRYWQYLFSAQPHIVC